MKLSTLLSLHALRIKVQRCSFPTSGTVHLCGFFLSQGDDLMYFHPLVQVGPSVFELSPIHLFFFVTAG